MIEVRHLQKSFGASPAVQDVSFDAPNGMVTGLVGENGAGKTTTLALIFGLIQADRGTVSVGADDALTLHRWRRIGALLDHEGLYDRLSADAMTNVDPQPGCTVPPLDRATLRC